MIKTSQKELLLPLRPLQMTVDKDLEMEETLPDYCPDISRLVRVDCMPYIESSEVNGDRCTVNGRVICTLLYETDYKNKLKSVSFEKEFTHNFELRDQQAAETFARSHARCSHISCKLQSPRRCVIRPRLKLDLGLRFRRPLHALDPGCGGRYCRTASVTYEQANPVRKEEFPVDEELLLHQSEKAIGDVIHTSVKLQPPQIVTAGGETAIKTTATVKMLYETEGEDAEPVMSVKTIPLSLNVQGLEEGTEAEVVLRVSDEKVSAELDNYGENRVIRAVFTANADIYTTDTVSEEVAVDVFSEGAIDSPVDTTVALPSEAALYNRSIVLDSIVTPERPFVCPLYDLDIVVNDLDPQITEEGILLRGTYTTSVLGRTADAFESFDFTKEFSQLIPIEMPDNLTDVQAQMTPIDYSVTTLPDGQLGLRITFQTKLTAHTADKATFITDISSSDPVAKSNDAASAVYFFPSPSDDLWSISKRYLKNPDAVRSANPNAFDENDNLAVGTRTVLIKK